MPVGLLAAAEDGNGLYVVALVHQAQGGQRGAEGGYGAGVDDTPRGAVGVEKRDGARGPDERVGGVLASFFFLRGLDYLLGGGEGNDCGGLLVSCPAMIRDIHAWMRKRTFDSVTGRTT